MPEGNQFNAASDFLATQETSEQKDKNLSLDTNDSILEENEMTEDERKALSSEITSMDLNKARKAFEQYKEVEAGSLDLSAKNFDEINYNSAISLTTERSAAEISELAKLANEFISAYEESEKNFHDERPKDDLSWKRGEFSRNVKNLGYKAEGFFGFGNTEALQLATFLKTYEKQQETLKNSDNVSRIKFLVDFNKDKSIEGSKTLFNSDLDGVSGMSVSESQLFEALKDESGVISENKINNLISNIGLPSDFLDNVSRSPLSMSRLFMMALNSSLSTVGNSLSLLVKSENPYKKFAEASESISDGLLGALDQIKADRVNNKISQVEAKLGRDLTSLERIQLTHRLEAVLVNLYSATSPEEIDKMFENSANYREHVHSIPNYGVGVVKESKEGTDNVHLALMMSTQIDFILNQISFGVDGLSNTVNASISGSFVNEFRDITTAVTLGLGINSQSGAGILAGLSATEKTGDGDSIPLGAVINSGDKAISVGGSYGTVSLGVNERGENTLAGVYDAMYVQEKGIDNAFESILAGKSFEDSFTYKELQKLDADKLGLDKSVIDAYISETKMTYNYLLRQVESVKSGNEHLTKSMFDDQIKTIKAGYLAGYQNLRMTNNVQGGHKFNGVGIINTAIPFMPWVVSATFLDAKRTQVETNGTMAEVIATREKSTFEDLGAKYIDNFKGHERVVMIPYVNDVSASEGLKGKFEVYEDGNGQRFLLVLSSEGIEPTIVDERSGSGIYKNIVLTNNENPSGLVKDGKISYIDRKDPSYIIHRQTQEGQARIDADLDARSKKVSDSMTEKYEKLAEETKYIKEGIFNIFNSTLVFSREVTKDSQEGFKDIHAKAMKIDPLDFNAIEAFWSEFLDTINPYSDKYKGDKDLKSFITRNVTAQDVESFGNILSRYIYAKEGEISTEEKYQVINYFLRASAQDINTVDTRLGSTPQEILNNLPSKYDKLREKINDASYESDPEKAFDLWQDLAILKFGACVDKGDIAILNSVVFGMMPPYYLGKVEIPRATDPKTGETIMVDPRDMTMNGAFEGASEGTTDFIERGRNFDQYKNIETLTPKIHSGNLISVSSHTPLYAEKKGTLSNIGNVETAGDIIYPNEGKERSEALANLLPDSIKNAVIKIAKEFAGMTLSNENVASFIAKGGAGIVNIDYKEGYARSSDGLADMVIFNDFRVVIEGYKVEIFDAISHGVFDTSFTATSLGIWASEYHKPEPKKVETEEPETEEPETEEPEVEEPETEEPETEEPPFIPPVTPPVTPPTGGSTGGTNGGNLGGVGSGGNPFLNTVAPGSGTSPFENK